jgi:hypothetical protein
MRGLPVEPVQIETAQLDRYKSLLLSYEGQKPPSPDFHDTLAGWVRDGGALVVIDDDRDPFNTVREWWNTGQMHYATPRQHLFDKLGLDPEATGEHRVGKGTVIFEHRSPSGLSRAKDGARLIVDDVKQAMSTTGQTWRESSALVLRRGPYIIAAGLDAQSTDGASITLRGRFILLFDAAEALVTSYTVTPGTRGVLVDLDRYPQGHTGVIAAACKVTNQKLTDDTLTFDTIGQDQTNAVVSILLPGGAPESITLDGQQLSSESFDYISGVLRLRFANTAKLRHLAVIRRQSR